MKARILKFGELVLEPAIVPGARGDACIVQVKSGGKSAGSFECTLPEYRKLEALSGVADGVAALADLAAGKRAMDDARARDAADKICRPAKRHGAPIDEAHVGDGYRAGFAAGAEPLGEVARAARDLAGRIR